MKKLLMVGLASILLIGLAACKQNKATDQTMALADQAAPTQPATPNATQPPTPNAAPPAAQPATPHAAPPAMPNAHPVPPAAHPAMPKPPIQGNATTAAGVDQPTDTTPGMTGQISNSNHGGK